MGLTVGIVQGGAVYIDDTKITVETIMHSLSFKVMVHAASMNHVFTISDRKATEVLPNVMMSAGNKGSSEMVKVVIDAPAHMKILREKLYLEAQTDAVSG